MVELAIGLRKNRKVSEIRNKLNVDQDAPFVVSNGLSLSEKLKLYLICYGHERLLVLFGPVFMRSVRKVKE